MKKQKCRYCNTLYILLCMLGSIYNPMVIQAEEGVTSSLQLKEVKVSGIVKDNSGEPLPGVTVTILNTSKGTMTDVDGQYTINAPVGGTLVFQFVGYAPQNITVKNGQNVINVKLMDDVQILDEVVVVGYGTQKKASLVAAISTITTKDLVQSPAANLSNALAGKLPGLTTVSNTGQPGKDDASLYIRGRSTWTDASPLYIVDGVERESFTQVDANEVETISILKDASATAVYGVRGANGVIIITTKRGRDQKPVVSLSVQQGFQKPTRLPNYLRSYETAKLRNESFLNDGYSKDKLPFQPEALEAFRTGSDPYHYPDVDWYDVVLRNVAPQGQYNANVRGGTKTARYFVSVGYFTQDGLFKTESHKDYSTNFHYNRLNFRSNLDVDVTHNLSLSLNLAARIEDTNEPGNTGYDGQEVSEIFSALTRTPPYETPVFQKNGQVGVGTMEVNPWRQLNGRGYTQNKKDVVEASLILNYKLDKLTKGLSLKVLASYDSYYSEKKKFKQTMAAYRLDSAPGDEDLYTVIGEDTELKYDGNSTGSYEKLYGELAVNYQRKFGMHDVSGLLLTNLENKKYGSDYIPYRFMGLVARLTYNYGERYFGEMNMGYNGSENFARGKRFGFFPSVSAGWLLSNESFLKDRFSELNLLKIRASFGMVGNDKIGGDRFMYMDEYGNRNGYTGLGQPSFGTSGSSKDIVYLARTGNLGLTWETSYKYNVGIESSFWKNKLSATLDLFYEKRNNIILNGQSIPSYLGTTPSAGNLGETSNKGFEIEAQYRDKIGQKFEWWVKANYSYSKNEVVFKDEPANKLPWQKEEGHSINQFFGYQVLGFFDITDFDANGDLLPQYPKQIIGEAPKPGDFRYKDINGDNIINESDKVAIGNSDIPRGIYGFSFGFNWHNFDFSALFQGVHSVSLQLSSESLYEFCERGKVLDIHRGRWAYYTDPFTGELVDTRATATYPRLHSQSSSPNWTSNDFFLYDSDYLKLRNVEIGYTFPKGIKKIGISQLRFYVNGSNLLTFSKVKQADPEGPGYGSNKERGWNYPQLAIYNFGFNVTF